MCLTFGVWGDTQIFGSSIAWLCALYGMTVWTTPRRFAVGAVFVLVSDLAAAAGPVGTLKKSVPFTVITLVVMLLVRRVVGDRERRAQLAERERDVAAREAVVEERARIARELHDAIAHNVSMMVVQAGAERRTLDDPRADRRGRCSQTIEQIGRGALTEMRRLVGMLRSDDGDPLAPQPGLDDLPTLVDAGARGRPAGRARRSRASARELPVGHRAVRLPDRPGGADERAQARRRRPRHGSRLATARTRSSSRSSTTAAGGRARTRRAAATVSSACASGSRSTAGASTPAARPSGGFAVRVLLPIR